MTSKEKKEHIKTYLLNKKNNNKDLIKIINRKLNKQTINYLIKNTNN